jgi:hypothetical protein
VASVFSRMWRTAGGASVDVVIVRKERRMESHELLAEARETFGVRREYGEPYERDGVTLIPVSAVRGGGGAGHDGEPNRRGGGFGLTAKPTGAWVIRGDSVEWKPAVDPMRIVLGAELVAALALWRTGRRKPRRGPHAVRLLHR